MSLANDYRPKDWDDVVEQGITTTILKNICNADKLSCRNFLLTGPAGCGKAQPLDSNVLTSDGFIPMRDVQVGTKVYTHNGCVSEVIGVYPQGVRPIYEITLSDRTKIQVSDEHLNVVYRYNQNKKQREDFVLTTKELISLFEHSHYKLRVDVPSVDWDSQDLPIDPYLLGLLIGDGSISNNNMCFCNAESDIVERMDYILRRDWSCYLNKLPGDNYDYRISPCVNTQTKYNFVFKGVEYNGCTSLLDAWCSAGYPDVSDDVLAKIGNMISHGDYSYVQNKYGLTSKDISCTINPYFGKKSGVKQLRLILSQLGLNCKSTEKHIPKQYLYNSFDNRLALLQGLIDTDGYVDVAGAVEYTTSSALLSDDFAFLARSFGIRDTVSIKHTKYKSKKTGDYVYCHDAYRHFLKTPNSLNFCTSTKHRNNMKKRQSEPLRNIVSIKYVGDKECQCIYVAHSDHTYISDGFIPTHNTTLARLMSNKINNGEGEIIEVDAASHSGAEATREIVEQAKTFPLIGKYKCIILDEVHSLSSQSFQVLLKVLEESPARTVWFLCTTNPEKIPKTVTSRVQQFQLSKISLAGIEQRIKYVLDSEIAKGRDLSYTPDGINFVAKLAHGGLRDALTTLDKVLVFSNQITSDNVAKSVNLPNYDDYFALLSAVAKHDNKAIVDIVDTIYNSGVNFIKWFEDFNSFVMNIIKYILLQDISRTMIPTQYEDKLSKYTTAHYSICLRLSNVLMTINNELRTTNYLQETVLARLCTLPPKTVNKG